MVFFFVKQGCACSLNDANNGATLTAIFCFDLIFFSNEFLTIILFFSRILNKLTPEKFDKLTNELLHVGIDTKFILKGIILLVSCLAGHCPTHISK